ncbi:hypothetical protein F3J20_01740 [Paraburkholderia sp. Cy-641]|uniref:hypothetical protein n=1 Tax=Paraburkholderia sp. Cy-641 TaxID=2608337 RepID=UPI00142289E8|nr:hypothetical protein [Paraburkholderia sp. Cy-641]NIF76127.1 hypothetical protein [Paraburkholderia sp. Cy-641]
MKFNDAGSGMMACLPTVITPTMKKLRSRKWPTLSRAGFTINTPGPSEPKPHWFRESIKHPAVLVILGFILTGLIGRWLADVQDEKQRQREAVVRSMDDLRRSIDDLSAAFSGYFDHAVALVDLMEKGAPADKIEQARTSMDAAREKWDERLAVDGPNILQRYPVNPDNTGSPNIELLLNDIELGTSFIESCIGRGTLEKREKPILDHRYQLFCHDTTQKNSVDAGYRLTTTDVCLRMFARLMRPDPKNDFSDEPVDRRYQQLTYKTVQTNCDLQYLTGLTDQQGHPRQ